MLEVELHDGRRVIIRAPNVEYEDASIPLINREIGILKWLKTNSSIPIPAIYSVVTANHPKAFLIIVMEKLPGTMVFNVVGKCPYRVKASQYYQLQGHMLTDDTEAPNAIICGDTSPVVQCPDTTTRWHCIC